MAAMPAQLPALEARLRLHDMVGERAQAEAIAERIVSLEPGRVSGETRLVEGLLQRDPAAAVARVQALIEQAPEAHPAGSAAHLDVAAGRAGAAALAAAAAGQGTAELAGQGQHRWRCQFRTDLPVGRARLGRGARGDRPGRRPPGAAQRPLHQHAT
ncbi:hypothetical protein G6F66_014630 [Rhizopus arrhizus]|nr:hypothetical protein G6F66_014630 [Rhizopus arrhizus]